MAKRFTDTGIWDKPWFRKLPPVEKAALFYVKDRCDVVGVWDADFGLANFQIGIEIDWQGMMQRVHHNIEALPSGKWWIPDFCQFQYGELTEACKPHRCYIEMLKRHGLYERVLKGYQKGFESPQEKEKEKEKEKDRGGMGGDSIPYAEIIGDLNATANTNYKPNSETSRKLIRARWAQGFRLENFRVVHRKKCKEWLGSEMAKYLRPETLYGTKFESYLNQPLQAAVLSETTRTNMSAVEGFLQIQEAERNAKQ